MKFSALALGALTLAAFAAVVMTCHYGQVPATYWTLVFDASELPRLIDLALTGGLAAVLMIGVFQLDADAATGRSGFLPVVMWVAPLAGLLGAAYSFLIIAKAMQATHTTNLQVVAPSAAQGLTPLAFGLLVGTAAALLSRRKARAA